MCTAVSYTHLDVYKRQRITEGDTLVGDELVRFHCMFLYVCDLKFNVIYSESVKVKKVKKTREERREKRGR